MITGDPHHLTGAYALDALSEEEREAFERHLAGCEPCARESAELGATAVRLGLAVSVTPHQDMRGQVLRRITSVRQEAPRTPGPPARPGKGIARARLLSRWTLAACLAVTALGGTAWWQYDRAEDALSRAHSAEQAERGAADLSAEVAAVLSAPDAKTEAGAVLADGATGGVVVSRARDRAVFVVSGLPRPPGGKTYQLWFDDGGGTMRPAGLLDPGRADQTVLMRGAVGRSSGMGITVEPEGGSPRPTSTPLALLTFA
ncbi:anti-sigma factor domain-containing protein [Streptomyces sp. NPDC091377]|uniref:anti-sigma factor n=1 Tax=Streptomyces sp. NPDC091377 TaxID=3365995 RepID=UPI0037FBA9FD